MTQLSLEEAQKRFPPLWTLYDHPQDHPNHIVVRVWFGLTPNPDPVLFESLEEARRYVVESGGCVKLCRQSQDDPCILETWL